MESSNHDCVFCREISGSTDTNFHRLYPEEKSRVVAETRSLVALPCIGQLSPHHCLILPKLHFSTLAEACASIPGLVGEIEDLLLQLATGLAIDPQTSLYFEHGAFGPAHGGCGIYHAHMHVVPGAGAYALDSPLWATASNPSMCLTDLFSQNLDPSLPYVMHGSYTLGFRSVLLSEPLPSQTLRRLLADQLGAKEWDWRKYKREDDSILQTLRGYGK